MSTINNKPIRRPRYPISGESITKNKVIDKPINTFEELFEQVEKKQAVFVTYLGYYIPAAQIIYRMKIWQIKDSIDNRNFLTLKDK